jgi:hypothetical protein
MSETNAMLSGPRVTRTTASRNGLIRFGMLIIIAGIIFVQRLGIPVGDQFVPLPLFSTLIGTGVIAVTGAFTLSRWKAEFWTITVAAMAVSIFFQEFFSPMSFWFLVIVYTPLVLVIDGVDDETYKTYLEPYQWMMIAVALMGVFQFVTVDSFDPFHRFGNWVIVGYNTHPPLSYGSAILRSNGYVLLEPSFLSQYCAIAILLELAFFHKLWRIPIYGAGMFASAGGTGIVVLLVFLISYAWHHKKIPHLIAIGVVGLFTLWMFSDNPVIANLFNRSTEIDQQGTSAQIRFVAPFRQVGYQLTDLADWIVGIGPGAANGNRLILSGWSIDQASNLMAWQKMLIEYGVLGAIPFTIFITRAFFYGSRSYVVSIAMFLCYMAMSASLQNPPAVYLSYIISMMFPIKSERI